MPMPDVTYADVLAAVGEFDRLGRDEFLANYGYGQAKDYFVRHDGKLYDSKAIAGAAHGVRHEAPLRPENFSGGDGTVARLLRGLGFIVTQPFDWTRDEVVLACALVYQNGWRTMAAETTEVQELSALLQRANIHPAELLSPRFRNPAGIEQKTGNLKTQHPDYAGRATNGGRIDREVIAEFIADPEGMLREAAAIRERIEHGMAPLADTDPDMDLVEDAAPPKRSVPRGRLTRVQDPVLRAAIEQHALDLAIEHYKALGAADVVTLGKPYDIRLTLDGAERHVEVKGSSVLIETVELTINEVVHSRDFQPTDLIVVDGINWTRQSNGTVATFGGNLRAWSDWTPEDADLAPRKFAYSLPDGGRPGPPSKTSRY